MTRNQAIPEILVVTHHLTDSFMKDDIRLLRRFGIVVPFETGMWRPAKRTWFWRWVRRFRSALRLAKYLLMSNCQVVIFWFVYAYETLILVLLSKLLLRKVIIITGGGDAVYVPEINWGAMQFLSQRISFSVLMRMADSILPFSDSATELIVKNFKPKRIQTAYPAVDVEFFVPSPETVQSRVVTCCYEYDAITIIQKGLDTFVSAARYLPNAQFVIVGNAIDPAANEFRRLAPSNVRFLPRIPSRSGYRDFLQSSSVYAQLSAHEGFGVSLAQAMACGCIPVVTNRYSLPEVVGDCGWIIPHGEGSAEVAAHAIESALAADSTLRERARKRMASKFKSSIRADQLHEELARLVPSLSMSVIRLDLGCGSIGIPGTIGVDIRMTEQTQAVCDVRRTCFASECADQVYSYCVLEHLKNPYELMDEIVRLLKPDGLAFLRVPNIGTYSAHLDSTHRFLADLKIWKAIKRGYFEEVKVVPVGTKYRDNPVLFAINWVLVNVFGFYELAQGWTFVCGEKRANPTPGYLGWWQELRAGQ